MNIDVRDLERRKTTHTKKTEGVAPLDDMVVEERFPHPLDELTRLLADLLHTQATAVSLLQESMRYVDGDPELSTVLANAHRQQALLVRHLEPQLGKRLSPYAPECPTEPW